MFVVMRESSIKCAIHKDGRGITGVFRKFDTIEEAEACLVRIDNDPGTFGKYTGKFFIVAED